MKKVFLLSLLSLCFTLGMVAKEMKIAVFNVNMHCASCEKRIKDEVRFEKGVKGIETKRADKTVTITYDADKNSAEKLDKKLVSMGYVVKLLRVEEPAKKSRK